MKNIIGIMLIVFTIIACGKVRDKNEYVVPDEIRQYVGNVQEGSWWKYENQYGQVDSCWFDYFSDRDWFSKIDRIVYNIESSRSGSERIKVDVGYYKPDGFDLTFFYGGSAAAVPFIADYRNGDFVGQVERIESVTLRNGETYYDVLKVYQKSRPDRYIMVAKNLGIIKKNNLDLVSEDELIEYDNLPN